MSVKYKNKCRFDIEKQKRLLIFQLVKGLINHNDAFYISIFAKKYHE